ncbi:MULTISPECIES: NAD(P)H-dependent oxidoreductase [unclassified Chelatococcus]|uniref:NADPH-dependent FMN reductase n=1 Tax=unclassified Chelatococcus TaxID=2638111 RepID=UPI001BCC6426|nr:MULTISPECIES: NAD(P)H-dependent oxidoreductase [unclassified Chelatococcus]CAH1659553.1 FMN reductase [Hyphomicrobiales bacterium]MBS7740960.1 NAD(P)H-dependent oxidoreductase [Chelatococcus sp. HY11]MBX3546749.1 NAD(P)H-dependent oxidoreductase [Chelatococcus sp.]MCO5077780.1 NAD(P)H-dependent oxidoreductase [Chelatococcus sp.]CAH1683774.1 FMN reductase [Hyphomicrobiales bacterium]
MSHVSIVALGGTTRVGSSSENAARFALAEAAKLGAKVQMFDGALLNMPMYAPESAKRSSEALELIAALRAADGVILASPGYHGGISGMLKNALDYTEDMREDTRVYLEHRSVGCIVCAAGWQAVGTTLTSLRSIVHALRGWPTPLGVGINTVAVRAFDQEGNCIDPNTRAQLHILAEQVVTFARFGKSKPPESTIAA